MLKVTKFGGSSLCDSAGFARVREIVLADPARRVVVVSAVSDNSCFSRFAQKDFLPIFVAWK